MESYPNSSHRTLSNSHRRMLYEESGISPEVAAERGYYTVRTRPEVPEAFAGYQRRLGLVVPMFSPDGTRVSHQLRPDRPRKEELKYETPASSEVIIDVHPRMLEEVRRGGGTLWVVEGVKKEDALVSRGEAAVALSGVWMAHVKGSKGRDLLPCWGHVRLSGRRVNVVFDSDWRNKVEVHDALRRLVRSLEAAGADVRVAYLEDAPDGSKVGADDFLVAGGTLRELSMLCGRFEVQDVARKRLTRDERLRARVEALTRRVWTEGWKGRGGHSDRDVAIVMAEIAAESGKVHPDGVRIKASWGVLQVRSKMARRTLGKALDRLHERGFCYRDNKGRKADKSGAFVLVANVDQDRGDAPHATTELQGNDPDGLRSQLPSEVPRLRWSRPKWTNRRGTVRGTRKVRESKPSPPQDRIERLGKIRGAVVDALVVAGGRLTLAELCRALHRSRTYDLTRRRRVVEGLRCDVKTGEVLEEVARGYDGPLVMLEEAGIIETADGVVVLAADWSGRLDDARRAGHELEADELAERDRRRKSRAYRRKDQVRADPHHANAGADGHVEDLRPVAAPEPLRPKRESSPDVDVVLGYVNRMGRIRLGLLEEIWLDDHGGDLAALRRAVEDSGVRTERLTEHRGAVFLYPPAEVA